MSCPTIITGDQFLLRVLSHIDCQAQVIGSYGYQALGEPGSTASLMVSSLLALFIALFGFRMLFGPQPGVRDLVYDILKIGIVVTLAFSWPAFRTVVYDVTLQGPAEIASVITQSSQPAGQATMVERLQAVDNNIVELIVAGTGRTTGQFLGNETSSATFAGTALQDDAAMGYSRLLYLAGVIAPLALLRIAAGLLLAITPIIAGLYFFTQSRGIVAGWAKGLVFTIGGSLAMTIGMTVQLAIVEPWLFDALNVRGSGYATPSAPLELFATMFAFLVVHFALLWVIARVVFYRGWPDIPVLSRLTASQSEPRWENGWRPAVAGNGTGQTVDMIPRAERISNSVENTLLRERSQTTERLLRESAPTEAPSSQSTAEPPRLGSSYRRPGIRALRTISTRDSKK